MPTINDLKKHLSDAFDYPASISCPRRIPEPVAQIIRVELYPVLFNVSGIPYEKVAQNVMADIEVTQSDTTHFYSVDDVDQGVSLCKELFRELKASFTAQDDAQLRQNARNEGTVHLLIVQRKVIES